MDKLIEYIVEYYDASFPFGKYDMFTDNIQNLEDAKKAAIDYIIGNQELVHPVKIEISVLIQGQGSARYKLVEKGRINEDEIVWFGLDWQDTKKIPELESNSMRTLMMNRKNSLVFDDPDVQMEWDAEESANECSAIMGEFDKHIEDEALGSVEYYALAGRLEKIGQHNASEVLENMGADEYTHYLILLGIREVLLEECR